MGSEQGPRRRESPRSPKHPSESPKAQGSAEASLSYPALVGVVAFCSWWLLVAVVASDWLRQAQAAKNPCSINCTSRLASRVAPKRPLASASRWLLVVAAAPGWLGPLHATKIYPPR